MLQLGEGGEHVPECRGSNIAPRVDGYQNWRPPSTGEDQVASPQEQIHVTPIFPRAFARELTSPANPAVGASMGRGRSLPSRVRA
jgi:hypothetical protein